VFQLSQTSEYALRALAQLAVVQDGKPMRAADLAALTHVPPAYVSKVMRKLVVAGLVSGAKGHHGGFKLARPAGDIRFIEVIQAVDPMPTSEPCAFGWGACNAASPCLLHPAFNGLNARVRQWAEQTTLDVVAHGSLGAERT
jgi:Rrf2 family protein